MHVCNTRPYFLLCLLHIFYSFSFDYLLAEHWSATIDWSKFGCRVVLWSRFYDEPIRIVSLSGLPGVSEVLRGLITGGNVCCVHSSKENKKCSTSCWKRKLRIKNETKRECNLCLHHFRSLKSTVTLTVTFSEINRILWFAQLAQPWLFCFITHLSICGIHMSMY